jgi:DNA helicase HerA-like ATPase
MSDIYIGSTATGERQVLRLTRANRHGLIAGATGTGKTVTLQTIAEQFSAAGVPVFLADVKGDLSGIAMAGSPQFKNAALLESRARDLGIADYADLQAVLVACAENAKSLAARYGNVSRASIGTIQRQLLAFESQGADSFFGEPAFEIADFLRLDEQGRGYINVLAAEKLMQSPKLYATFLLWLLSELFEALPEVGDPEKPVLVFFFDEAHLLFDDAPAALFDKVEQVVRLIRSKGVGVYFITQNPIDIPEKIAGQLGNRVQHALRAFTPRDQRAIRAAAQTFRINPALNVETAITELKVGEALISTLHEDGSPSIVQRALIVPPRSRLGPITAKERAVIRSISPVDGKYDTRLDRESAAEVLAAKAADATQVAQEVEYKGVDAVRAQPRKTATMWERAGKAAIGAAAASAGTMVARSMTGRRSSGNIGAAAASAVGGSLGTAIGGAAFGRFARGLLGGLLR